MANGNDTDTPQDTTQRKATSDPFGILGDDGAAQQTKQKPQGKATSDPLGLYSSPDQAQTEPAPEDTVLESVQEQLSELQKKPPIKIKQPEGRDGTPKSNLLQESEQELGLNEAQPFPELQGSMFNTAEAVSTGVAPTIDEQGIVDISEARKKITEVVDGYDEEPIQTRRRIADYLGDQYNTVIEEAEQEGDEEYVEQLKHEQQNISRLKDHLLERETAEFESSSNFFGQTYRQLKKSAVGVMLGMEGRAISDNEVLDAYNYVEENGEVPDDFFSTDDISTKRKAQEYLDASPEERKQLKAAQLEELAHDFADMKSLRKTINSIPMHPQAEKFLTATSYGEMWEAFTDNPLDVMTEVAFGNAAHMGASMVAGVVGGVAGTAVAGPAGGKVGAATLGGYTSAFMEYGNVILEELSREGVDIEKEKEVIAAVQDEELMERVKSNARKGASIVGFLDAAAFGLAASRFIPKGTVDDIGAFIGREALDESIQIGGQGILGGAGAGLSELARTGEIKDYGEIGAEVLGESVTAPFRAFGIRKSIRMMETARSRHIISEYITGDEVLNKIRQERRKAVAEGNEGRVAAADRLTASVKQRRGKMVEESRPRLLERRERLERKIRDMEEKYGARASSKADYQAALVEYDAVNGVLEGERLSSRLPQEDRQQQEQQQQTEEQDDGTVQQDEATQTEQVSERDREGDVRQEEETQAQEEAPQQQEQAEQQEAAQPDDTAGRAGEQGADSGVESETTAEDAAPPLQDRLQNVEEEIQSMEALEDKDQATRDYLDHLYSERERLQAKVRVGREQQQEEQATQQEPSVDRYLLPEDGSGEASAEQAQQTNSTRRSAWEDEGSPKKVERGHYVYRLGDNMFEIQRNENGKWFSREVNDEMGVTESFNTRKEAVEASRQLQESYQNADENTKETAASLENKGMQEAAQEVIEKGADNPRGEPKTKHQAVQVEDNTYNYRGYLVRKAEDGNHWEIVRNGRKVDTAGTRQAGQEQVDNLINGQVAAESGQELGTAVNSDNLQGSELPKSNLKVANRSGDQVYVGGLLDNHGSLADRHSLDPEQVERGFITPDGRFLTRNEALQYTRQQNIAVEEGGAPGILMSEQLNNEKKKPEGTVVNKKFKEDSDVRQETKDTIISRIKGSIENWGNGNTLVTKEELQQAQFRLSRPQALNTGIGTQWFKDNLKVATYHIEAGVREFADFARLMIADAGKQVVPHLRTLYNEAIKDIDHVDRSEFSDTPEINRFFLEYYKDYDQEVLSVSQAQNFVEKTTGLVDEEVKPQLQHQALTELAKAYRNESTEITSVLDFMAQIRSDYEGSFDRAQIASAWSVSLNNTDERKRFWFTEQLSEKTGIDLHVLSFFHDLPIIFRKKVQDSFIGQKRIQREIEELRGHDYFDRNERLDAYLQEELVRGRVSQLQWEVTSMDNPNSTIRQILQIAKENDLEMANWKTYYTGLRRADKLRQVGLNSLAEKVEQRALENDPNQNDDIQQYLHAKHAREANQFLVEQIEEKIAELELQLEQIPDNEQNKRARASIKAQITLQKKKIPDARRGSGMTNDEAQQVIDNLEQQGKLPALEQIAEKVYEINELMLDMREENGLNSSEEINELRERFDNYVPLNRILFDPYGNLLDQFTNSTTGNVPGANFKRRTGSDRPVDNILGSTISNYDKLIGDIEKNNVVATLAELYDSEWAQGNEQYGRSVRASAAEDAAISDRVTYRKQNPDGSVEERALLFNSGSKLVFDAIEKMGQGHNSNTIKAVIGAVRSFTNWLRFMRTSASMNFLISNPQRDIGTVMGNMASDFGYNQSLKFAKNMFHDGTRLFGAHRSIWEYLRGEDTPGARAYKRLKDLGGTTGFYQLSDRADILRDLRKIEKDINDQMFRSGEPLGNTRKGIKKAFNGVKNGIELMNEIMENATRLTAFQTALENGYSERRAASYALNVNTNFNKSGDWGELFKVGYQFANSAIQGHARLLRAAKVDPQTFTKTITSLMALGAANSSFNDWMNEEAHERLKRTRPWLFNNNLVFIGPSGGVMGKIYLPFGYNVFKAAGDIFYDAAKGNVDMEEGLIDMGNAFADSFNPFRGSQMFNGGVQGLMMAATPTAFEPITEIGINESFFGNIYPPFQNALQEEIGLEDFQIKYGSVNPYMEYVSNFLYKHDVADMSPETIEHMTYFLGGSAGREWINLFSKSLSTDKALRDGITLYPREDGTDVKLLPNNVPIMSRFLNTVDIDRTAIRSIYNTTADLSKESFDVQSDDFGSILDQLSSDYEVLLENDYLPESDREQAQGAMNAFVKTVFKNDMKDQAVQTFREEGLTGEENEAARQRYYERINRQTGRYRIPQLDRTDRANFRLLPYGGGRAKIFDDAIIEQIETKVTSPWPNRDEE